jgi:hypothetical protein
MMGGTRKPPAQPARAAKIRKIRRVVAAKKSGKKELPEQRNQPPEYHVPDENRIG